MQDIVTKAELARRLGLTRQRINKFCNNGMPVRPEGTVDLDAALSWVATTRQAQACYTDRGVHKVVGAGRLQEGRNRPPPIPIAVTPESAAHDALCAPAVPSYAESRALRESALAQLAQLKLAQERGDSVSIEIVKRDWVSTLTDLRGRLLAVPARVAAACPHLTQGDIAIISVEVSQALKELSGAVETG